MMRHQLCTHLKDLEGFYKTEALLCGSLERKPGWRFTARLTQGCCVSQLHPSWSSAYSYYFTKKEAVEISTHEVGCE